MNTVAVMIDIVLPVFGVIAIGYGAAKAGWMGESAIDGLNQFCFNIAIPLLLFRLLATSEFPETAPWGYLVTYYGGVGIVYLAAILLGGRLFGFTLVEGAVFGLCAGFSNTIMIGIPLVLRAFGEEASFPLFVLIGLHGVILMTLTTVLAEIGLGRGDTLAKLPRAVGKRLISNPIIIGLLAGFAYNLTGQPLPQTLDAVLETLGSAALPCATFAIGTSISRFHLAGSVGHLSLITVLKLLVHPVLVWVLGRYAFDLSPLWLSVAVLLAALPVGITGYLFAERYRVIVPAAASAVLVSTILSFLTVSVVLSYLGVRG